MTSSLVGSEMCIRDSSGGLPLSGCYQSTLLSSTSPADSDMPAARAKALAPTDEAEGAPPAKHKAKSKGRRA
eukprot:2528630-Prorocentrum_lima.AAC.1